MLSRKEVFNDIDVEDPNSSNTWKLAVLTEELGEVAKVVVDGSNRVQLRNELTQVAAVAVAWLESL
jgi:NTP pyrophosphatase (non-canonical NTP hydrolase)